MKPDEASPVDELTMSLLTELKNKAYRYYKDFAPDGAAIELAHGHPVILARPVPALH
jgi:hypothetical protein